MMAQPCSRGDSLPQHRAPELRPVLRYGRVEINRAGGTVLESNAGQVYTIGLGLKAFFDTQGGDTCVRPLFLQVNQS